MRKINYKRLWPIAVLAIALLILTTPLAPKSTKYIDSTPENIKQAITFIESESDTDYQRIKNTAEYINNNVEYSLVGESCFLETAEDVLNKKTGDCVSTSKLAAAILSGMDIPFQIVEGCVFLNDEYSEARSAYIQNFQVPDQKELGNKKAGGQLHNWIRAYDGARWHTIETTVGVVFPTQQESLYGYNNYGDLVDATDPYDLCLLTDDDYVAYCKG
jgi:transglutaminase-like putative cysteine protease